MNNDNLSVKKKCLFLTLACLSISMVSCGGGSSQPIGVSSTDPTLTPPDSALSDDLDNPESSEEEGLPDFTILDVTVSSQTNGVNHIFVQTTIANNGDIAAVVPSGWFKVSTDLNVEGNYKPVSVQMVPIGEQTTLLQPGESGRFNAVSPRGIDNVDVDLRRSGTHYGQLWLNPDLSAQYENIESIVMESYNVEEIDYDNNLSDLVTFESVKGPNTGPDCTVDAYEQNDSEPSATQITTNTIYEFNACDEGFELMTIELTAGNAYELVQHPNAMNSVWQLTLIDPDGQYLLRDIREALVIPEKSGPHLLVAKTYDTPSALLNIEVETQ